MDFLSLSESCIASGEGWHFLLKYVIQLSLSTLEKVTKDVIVITSASRDPIILYQQNHDNSVYMYML